MACSLKELPLDYLKTPDTAALKRYNEKLNLIGSEDPYSMGSDSYASDPSAFPDVANLPWHSELLDQQPKASMLQTNASMLSSHNAVCVMVCQGVHLHAAIKSKQTSPQKFLLKITWDLGMAEKA